MGVEDFVLSIIPSTVMNPKCIEKLMLPEMITSWIFGMGIIEFPLGIGWPILSFIYTLIIFIAYSYMVQSILNHSEKFSETTTQSEKIIFHVLFYANICLNIWYTMLGWIRVKGVKRIIERLDNFDNNLNKIGIARFYRVICFRQLTAFVVRITLIILFMFAAYHTSTMDSQWSELKMMASFAIYYPVIVSSVAELSYAVFVRFVGIRFQQLNERLMKLSTTTEESPQHKRVLEYTRLTNVFPKDVSRLKRTNDDPNVIKMGREYHRELIEISYMINRTFGPQALLSMAVTFFLMTGLLFHICIAILWSPVDMSTKTEEIANAGFWFLFCIFRIFSMTSHCAETSRHAKKTGNILCHLHEPSTRKEFRDNIREFTLQITQHPLTFSACGFFNLNYGLIQGMISTVTTYLIILVQIHPPLPAENNTLSQVTTTPYTFN